MRTVRIAIVLVLVAVGSWFVSAGQALAGPGSSTGCSGSLCLSIGGVAGPAANPNHGSSLAYTINVPSDVYAPVTLQTHEDAALPVEAGTVTIDGLSQPDTAAPVVNGDLSVDLRLGSAFLSAGTHTVEFTVIPSGPPAGTSYVSWASLTFNDGIEPDAVSNSADVLLPYAAEDFSLGVFSGANPQLVQPNSWVDIPFNVAPGDQAGVLTVTLPPGFAPGATIFETDLSGKITATPQCTGGAVVTCPIPVGSDFFDLLVQSDATGVPGSIENIGLSVAPTLGVDPNPANNSGSFPVVFEGASTLQFTISPSTTAIPVGTTVHYTVTVKNIGPSPAQDVKVIVDGPEPSGNPPGYGVKMVANSPNITAGDEHSVEWSPGTLGVGESATLDVALTGNVLGAKSYLDVYDERAANAQSPSCFVNGCDVAGAHLDVTVVGTGTPAATTTTTTTTATGPDLADTGAHTSGLSWGVATVLAGITLCVLARPRRRGAHER